MFRRDSGIRLKLQGESIGSKLLPWGRSYAIPKRLESSHILLMGDAGCGKSSAIRQILRQVKERADSAIVYDPAMDFVGEFYSPERGDMILNSAGRPVPYWSLPDEILNDEIATSIAAALVPEKEYEKAFFTDTPRRVLAHLLRRKPQVRDLLWWMSDPEAVAAMVKGTPLAAYLDPGAYPKCRVAQRAAWVQRKDGPNLRREFYRRNRLQQFGRPPSPTLTKDLLPASRLDREAAEYCWR